MKDLTDRLRELIPVEQQDLQFLTILESIEARTMWRCEVIHFDKGEEYLVEASTEAKALAKLDLTEAVVFTAAKAVISSMKVDQWEVE